MVVELSEKYFQQIMTPFHMSMGIMSCYIAIGIAYNLAQSYRLDPLPTAMLSLMTFLLIATPMEESVLPGSFLNATGIFSAILLLSMSPN